MKNKSLIACTVILVGVSLICVLFGGALFLEGVSTSFSLSEIFTGGSIAKPVTSNQVTVLELESNIFALITAACAGVGCMALIIPRKNKERLNSFALIAMLMFLISLIINLTVLDDSLINAVSEVGSDVKVSMTSYLDFYCMACLLGVVFAFFIWVDSKDTSEYED